MLVRNGLKVLLTTVSISQNFLPCLECLRTQIAGVLEEIGAWTELCSEAQFWNTSVVLQVIIAEPVGSVPGFSCFSYFLSFVSSKFTQFKQQTKHTAMRSYF